MRKREEGGKEARGGRGVGAWWGACQDTRVSCARVEYGMGNPLTGIVV